MLRRMEGFTIVPPKMQSVYSSHVDKIGHDPESGEFHVHYRDGTQTVYAGVTPEQARDILTSASIGKAIHRVLKKGGHEYRGA